jgi:hypothetical protein
MSKIGPACRHIDVECSTVLSGNHRLIFLMALSVGCHHVCDKAELDLAHRLKLIEVRFLVVGEEKFVFRCEDQRRAPVRGIDRECI